MRSRREGIGPGDAEDVVLVATNEDTTAGSGKRRRRVRLLIPLALAAGLIGVVVAQRLSQPHTALRCSRTARIESFGPETSLTPPLRPTPEEAMGSFFAVYRPSSEMIVPVAGYRVYKRTPSAVTFVHGHDAAVVVTLGGSSARNLSPRPLGSAGSPWAVAQVTACAP